MLELGSYVNEKHKTSNKSTPIMNVVRLIYKSMKGYAHIIVDNVRTLPVWFILTAKHSNLFTGGLVLIGE